MKKIILISLFIIVLAVGGTVAYISQIDWNAHKEKLAFQLSNMIGKKIQFSGNLQVKFLPHPRLSADDVNILNSEGNKKLATIKQLETEVSLPSLLKGKADIQSLSFDGLEAWFIFDDNGVSNWRNESKSASFMSENSFDLHNFNIKQSIIHFNYKKYDISFDLTGFNADVQAGGVDGPYRLDGSFLKDNDRYGIALSIDALSQLEDSAMRVVITHPRTESNLRYDGSYNYSADEVRGELSGQSQKTADFVNSLINNKLIREEFNSALMFSTSLQSDKNGVSFSDLVIKYEDLMEGAGSIEISAADENNKREANLKYQLVSLNLRPFIKLAEDYFARYQKGAKYMPDTDFDLSYDVSSERVVINDEPTGFLENVSASGDWKDDIFSLDDFYAACPGNIVLNMKASLQEKKEKPLYFAEVNMNGQNALSLVNAFITKIKSPRQSSYRELDISFDLHGTPQFLNVENIDLKMDKAEIQGDLSADLIKKEYQINANADILNLDNYIKSPENEGKSGFANEIAEEIKRWEWLQSKKIAAIVKAKSASYKGVSARNVELDFVTDGKGLMVVDKAKFGSMFGTDVSVSAILENMGKDNFKFEDVTFDVKSSGLKMLADKWHIDLPKWPMFDRAIIEESGNLYGNLHKIYVNSLTKTGEHSFIYEGLLDDGDKVVNFSGDMLLKTADVEKLMKLISNNISGKVYRGPLVAKAEIKGNSKSWELKNADIQMGPDKYTADLNISEERKAHKVAGKVHTNYLNLLNWINIQKTKNMPKFSAGDVNTFIAKPNFSGDVINYSRYKDWHVDVDLSAERSSYGDYLMNDLKTHIYNEQNVLNFQNLKYENNNHKVQGNLRINYAQTPQMSGNLKIEFPQIKNLGGSLYSLSANGLIVDTEFETAAATIDDMVNGLKGKMNLAGNSLLFKGINLEAIKDDLHNRDTSKGLYKIVRDNVQSGETSFETFDVNAIMNNGVLSISPSTAKNSDASMTVSGSVNLKEWKINDTFIVKYLGLEDVPDYSFSFSGMLNNPTVDINIEKIVSKYDKYWKEIEEEQKKQQELIRQQQAEKIEQIQNAVKETEDSATVVLRNLEMVMSGNLSEEFKNRFEEKLTQINDINTKLEEIKTKLNSELTGEEIEQYRSDVEVYRQQIDSFGSEVDILISEYFENKKTELFMREEDLYEKISETYDNFQNMINEDREQLERYGSLNYIDDNEMLNANRDSIQKNKSVADEAHRSFQDKYNEFSSLEVKEDKNSLLKSMEDPIKQEDDVYPQIQEIHNQSADMLLKMVESRRAVYEEELRKQAELDAQNLLISGGSKQPVEETKDKNDGKDDNLSKDNAKDVDKIEANLEPTGIENKGVSGKIITRYEENKTKSEQEKQPSDNLLSPVNGDVTKVSGSIKIKQ